jgi:dTMP kinase
VPSPVPLVDAVRSAAADGGGFRGVLQIKAFRKLWFALSLSSFGDWLGFLAQTALASSLGTGSGYLKENLSVGAVVIVRLLPAVLLGPLAGAFADRFDRRTMMVVADCARFGLYVSIPIVHTLWWLFVATFLIETMSLFWIPAKEASVPNLVPPEKLEQANQLSLLTTYGSAPVAALVFSMLTLFTGVLARAFPFLTTNKVDLALYFDAATFLVSAITIFTLREISHRRLEMVAQANRERADASAAEGAARTAADGPASEQQAAAGLAAKQSMWRAIVEGWQFIGDTALVRGLVVGMLGAFAAAGVVVGLAKIYVNDLGGGNPGYGAVFGSVFVGLAAGMFLGPKLLQGLSRRRLFGSSIATSGLLLIAVAVVHNLVLVVLGVLLLGACSGAAWVTGYTLLGLEVEDSKRGRTWATLQSLMKVDLLVMVAAGPFVSGALGVHTLRVRNVVWRGNGSSFTLLGAGFLAFLVGLVAYRQMDDRDVPLWRDVIGSLRGWHPLDGRGVSTGLFVAFEGGEGAGKSTQTKLLTSWLAERGYEVVTTREPGATPIGRQLRQLLLDRDADALSPRAEALLYAADRAQHVAAVIRPALGRGAIVVTDRYVDSSLAYQGAGRALSTGEIDRLSQFATSGLKPDLTVLLDIRVSSGLARTSARDAHPDRLEAESAAFHERVRSAFRELADAAPDRYVIVDAELPAAEIHQQIVRRVSDVLPALSPDLRRKVHLKAGKR